jgi:hypothetical protein
MPPASPPTTLILPETSSSTFKSTFVENIFPAGTKTVAAVAMHVLVNKKIDNKSNENQVKDLALSITHTGFIFSSVKRQRKRL